MKAFHLSLVLILFIQWNFVFTQINLDSGLVAKYYFNGNATDESGNGNDGVVHGATLTTDRFGNSNSAYYFNGNGDYIDLGSPSQLKFSEGETFTISAWINRSNSEHEQSIVSFGDNSYHLYVRDDPYSYIQWAKLQVANFENSSTKIFVNQNEWYHIVAINCVGQYVKIYINGTERISVPFMYSYNYWNNLHIGYTNEQSNFYFNGIIDDVSFYNRALENQEVMELYQEGMDIKVSQDNFIFEPSDTTTTIDITADSSWTISSNVEWIKVSSNSGTGNVKLIITVASNDSCQFRDGEIHITGKTLVTIYVHQKPSQILHTIFQDSFLLDEHEQVKYIKITSKAEWKASSFANWLSISPNSGIGNSTLKLSVSANTSGKTRTTQIYVGSNCITTINIEQQPLLVIKSTLKPPSIDGYANWEEWNNEWQTLTANSPLNTTSALNARFQMTYDDKNLYLVCEVRGEMSTDTSYYEPANIILNDGIGLFIKIDTTNLPEGEYDTDGTFMFNMRKDCIFPNHFKWWNSYENYGSDVIFKNDTNFKIAQKELYSDWGFSSGYSQEWQIPWADLTNDFKNRNGKFIKFEIGVIDNNSSTRNIPSQQLFWRNASGEEWYDTRTFSLIRLAGIPAIPENLTATLNSKSAILQWNRISEENFLCYRIYQSTSSGEYILVDSIMNDISLTTKTIANLESNNTYAFKVTSVNTFNVESDSSNKAVVALPILIIKETDKRPLLDGLVDSNDPWISSWNNLKANHYHNETYGMTARFQLQYDEENLYLICQQKGNTTVDTSLNPDTRSYLNDCLEVFIKLGAENALEGKYIEGTYHFRMRRACIYPNHFDLDDHPDHFYANRAIFVNAPNFKIVQFDDGTNYTQEWQMPWKVLENEVVEWDGKYIRFELQASDNTTGNERGRTQQIFWIDNTDVQYMDTRSFSIVALESGLSGHSTIKSISKGNNCIHLYPNPASNQIHFVSPTSSSQPSSLQLFDYTGRQILTQTLPAAQQGETVTVNLGKQPEGVYLVRFRVGEKLYSGKVLVVK